MAKYISGRSKKVPLSRITDDRYRYLSVGEAEPDLGDPLVGPSSIGAKPVVSGAQYIMVGIEGYPGERYWIPNQGGVIPGSISVFDENVIVGTLSSVTQLNFKGAVVRAEEYGIIGTTSIGATITVFAPGNDTEVIFNSSDEFSTDTRFAFDNGLLSAGDRITVGTGGTVITTTGIGSVGIGTTNPTQELHLQGDLRLTGTIYDSNNQPGDTGNLLVKTVTDGILWVTPNSVNSGAGGTIGQIQFHNTAGLVDGADNFYFDYINSRVGIGSTQPTQLLDVLGVSTFSGGVFIDDLSVSGFSTFTEIIDANSGLDVFGHTELDSVNVSGLSTFVSNVDMNAGLDVDGQTDLDVLNVSETASFTATTDNTLGNVNTGAVQLDGGAGIAKNLTVGQTIQATNLNITGIGTISEFDFGTGLFDNIKVTGISTLGNVKVDGSTIYTNSGTLTLDSSGNSVQVASSDRLVVNNTTQSTSKDNGAIVVEGGVGIEKNLNVGGISTFSDVLYVKVPTAVNSVGSVAGSHLISRFINLSSDNAERGLEIGAPSTNVYGPSYLKVYGTTNRFAILDQYDNENLTILDDVINSGRFGLVGIGSTLPKEKLDVDGNVVPSVDSTYDLGGSSNKWDNVYANTFNGTFVGNADTASQVSTGTTTGNSDYFLTFVDSNNATRSNEFLYTDSGIVYNPFTNDLFTISGDIVAGKGSGSVALTINDGYGNANIAFNHQNGIPDVTGNCIRLETNVDSTSIPFIDFELGSGTAGVVTSLTRIVRINENGFVPGSTSTFNLGSSSLYWDNLYVNNIYGATITGTITNLAGGAAGSIPYQSAANTTTFLAEPNITGRVLTYNNTTNAPQWSDLTTLSGAGYTLEAVDSGNNVILRLSDGSTNDDVTITAGSNITIDPVASGGFTISAVAGAGLTTDSTISDLISVSGGTISADDAGADRIFFWDDSESKATHLGVGTGLQISGTTLSATSDAGKTYTLDSVDSGDNVILRLSDGSTNDDVTITAGSNITIDPVASGGFTISAVADGSGGILSDVDVVQENYECTNPITTATNAGITTITIGEDSNAYGTRYVQATEPTGVCDGDIWYDTSGASGSSDIPSGSVMLFVQASAPTGWTKLTSHNNKALRIVSGTGGGSGGSTAFTTVFSSRTTTGSVDPHTLTISQMPSHSHTMRNTGSDNLNDGSFVKNFNYITNTGTGSATGSTGGNGSHSHGFTGGTMDFAVQYVDAIICQKN